MDYITMRARIEDIVKDNHRDFIKAMISIEKGINNESVLDKLYDTYMDNDNLNLLNEEFDYMIEKLRGQGIMKKDIQLIVNLNEFTQKRYKETRVSEKSEKSVKCC